MSRDEAKHWQSKIEACSNRAVTPLHFAMAAGDDMPLPLEVVRNDQGQVIVHVFRRPDVPQARGEAVVMQAFAEVFGKPTASMRDPQTGELNNCFYRDEEEIRLKNGLQKKLLQSDSWYLEMPLSTSSVLPDSNYLRDKLALAVKKAWGLI